MIQSPDLYDQNASSSTVVIWSHIPNTFLQSEISPPVQMLKDSITYRGRGLKQVDLWRFSGLSPHLLYVLQPLPLLAQSQQRNGMMFHTPSSSVTQLDLKLFLFLRLHSVEAGGLQLCNKKHIQCNSAGLSSDSRTALEWGLED